jgi:nucleoid DNA-binding protein
VLVGDVIRTNRKTLTGRSSNNMNKGQLLKHLQRVASEATTRKKLSPKHVRAVVDELQNVWAKSLQEKGSASMPGFGRFDIQKGKGTIKFTPGKLLRDKLSGDVSSSANDLFGGQKEEEESDSDADSDSDDEKR